MDVEKLRKINELAKELRDHNMCSTMDEAYAQAESMISGNTSVTKISSINEGKDIETQNIVALRKTTNRIDEIEKQITDIYSQINEIKGLVNEIVTEILKLKEQKKEEPRIEKQIVLETKQQHQHFSGNEPSHPRVGGYKPEDVAIDKMFYFGHK